MYDGYKIVLRVSPSLVASVALCNLGFSVLASGWPQVDTVEKFMNVTLESFYLLKTDVLWYNVALESLG